MSEVERLKYRAFFSYAHADARWGRWLHKQLETFRVDRSMVGRKTKMGTVPKTLRPIFLDREDFSVGHTLSEATVAALDSSAALIVLCSTVSATRSAVNEEIRLFRSRHPDRPVIPVIINGVYPDNYPVALRFDISSDGELTDRPTTILGPDLRAGGEGKQLGIAKIVAGLLGVDADEIAKRAEQQMRLRMRQWVAVLSVATATLLGLLIWAEFNRLEALEQRRIAEEQRRDADERRQEAQANFELAKQAADALVFDIAKGLRDQKGFRQQDVLKILGTAQASLEKLTAASPNNRELQQSQFEMLLVFGDTFLEQGMMLYAGKNYFAAMDIAVKQLVAQPDRGYTHFNFARITERVANTMNVMGGYDQALTYFRDVLGMFERLAVADPDNKEKQYNVATILVSIGEAFAGLNQTDAAYDHYLKAHRIYEKLNKDDPDNENWLSGLGVSHRKLGGVYARKDNPVEAFRSYKESALIFERLANTISGKKNYMLQFTYAMMGIGSLLAATSAHDIRQTALESYLSAEKTINELLKEDPISYEYLDCKFRIDIGLGDFHTDERNISLAERYYYDACNAIDRMAKLDIGGSLVERHRSLCLNRLAGIFEKKGDLPKALSQYQTSLGIITEISRTDPDAWLENFVFVHEAICRVQLKLTLLDESVESCRAALSFNAKLLSQKPSDSHAPRVATALAHKSLALALVKKGLIVDARSQLTEGLALLYEAQKKSSSAVPIVKEMIDEFEHSIKQFP